MSLSALHIVTILAVLTYLATGGMKVIKLPWSLERRDELRMSATMWTITGALEILAAVGLLVGLFVPALQFLIVLVAACLVALIIAALAIRVRVGNRGIAFYVIEVGTLAFNGVLLWLAAAAIQ